MYTHEIQKKKNVHHERNQTDAHYKPAKHAAIANLSEYTVMTISIHI